MSTSDLIGGKGSGYGADIGVQRIQRLSPDVTAYFGAAFLNVGDIQFGGGASPQRGDLSIGTGLKFKYGITAFTLAYDVQQLNRSDSFSKKQMVGGKFKLPLFDLFGGLHQGFLTYGAAFDVWIARISGTIYREELGPYQKQDPEDRYALRIDVKMDL
jgi:hypothetical protein